MCRLTPLIALTSLNAVNGNSFLALVYVLIVLETRESAFVHAISSAGVGYAVTKACSRGLLSKCGCDRTIQGQSQDGFDWSGCSDNIAYGSAFSTAFVDTRERGQRKRNSSKALMNLHNNQAGRKVCKLSNEQN